MIVFASVVLSMWLMNLYNFMDGIDTIVVNESIFVLLIYWSIILLVVIFICTY